MFEEERKPWDDLAGKKVAYVENVQQICSDQLQHVKPGRYFLL